MALILGVDIGGTDIKLGIVGETGREVVGGKIPTRSADGPRAAAARVRGWLDAHASAGEPVAAAGIDCAGLIDGGRGFLHVSPNLAGWSDVPLRALFEEALGVAVVVENDANAAAYGEWRLGAGRGLADFVCLTLGTGVGGGIIANGALYRGATGFAGEIGHAVILADGPPCSCGNRGCLEALAGAGAILRRARETARAAGADRPAWGDDLTVETLARAANDGDGIARAAFAETGRFLGIGLVNVVHVLAPEAIAIGGGVAGAGDLIFAPARATMRAGLMDEAMARTAIVPARLGNRAAVLGAALLALERSREAR